MCGRFTLRTPLNLLNEYFLFHHAADLSLTPKYNIAPTQSVATLTVVEDRRILQWMHWGFIPGWSADPSFSSRMINARSETIHEKPAFRSAFRKRRCLIMADGYYEWKSDSSGKQPIFIHANHHQPFAFAGIWESWQPPRDRSSSTPVEPWHSTAIVTTEANDITKHIHHRMPVILDPENYDFWLQEDTDDLTRLQQLVVSPPNQNQMSQFEMTAVSKRVNRVTNDDEDCLKPAPTQQELF